MGGGDGVFFHALCSGLGAAARGKRFRVYSIATMVIVLACGAVTGTYAARTGGLPTPWVGVWERITSTAYIGVDRGAGDCALARSARAAMPMVGCVEHTTMNDVRMARITGAFGSPASCCSQRRYVRPGKTCGMSRSRVARQLVGTADDDVAIERAGAGAQGPVEFSSNVGFADGIAVYLLEHILDCLQLESTATSMGNFKLWSVVARLVSVRMMVSGN